MKKLKIIFTICFVFFALCGNALAAADTSCDNEDNEFINQRLAMCSVHAYNIGITTNPSNASQKQLMRDVIGLKTTIMTQQMKKQYDFLEVTVKRFKTQLEKAILVSQMEAKGAPSEDKGGSGGNSAYLNCGIKSEADTIQCVRQNISGMSNEISGRSDNSSVTMAFRKQLEEDGKNVLAFSAAKSSTISENCTGKNVPTNVGTAKACMQAINGGLSAIQAELDKRSQRGFNIS